MFISRAQQFLSGCDFYLLTDVYSTVDFKAPTLSPLCSSDDHLPPKGRVSFWTGLALPSIKPLPESLYALTYVCCVCQCVGACRGQERVADPQELELQDLVDYLMWVLETNCRSPERAASTLNHLATSAGPFLRIL